MQQITIRAARVNSELTQAEMADKLGISLSLYQDIETGTRPIKPMELYAFCHVTGFAEHDIKLPVVSAKSELMETT